MLLCVTMTTELYALIALQVFFLQNSSTQLLRPACNSMRSFIPVVKTIADQRRREQPNTMHTL